MKRVKIIAAALAAAILISAPAGCAQQAPQAQVDTSVAVEVAQAQIRDISTDMKFSGKIFAESDVAAFATVPGKITDVFVKVGDRLNKNDKLFVVNAEDIMRQYKPAKAAYDRAKAAADQTVAKGKKDIEDLEALYAVGAVAKTQIDNARFALDQQQVQLSGQLDQLKLALDQLQDSLDDLTVRAPAAGVVTAVNVSRDSMVSNAQPAVVISNTKDISLKFDISESVFGSFSTGMNVKYSIPSAGVAGQSAAIHSLSPKASEMTQLYTAELLLDNSGGKLTPGLFAEVSAMMGRSDKAVVIPSSAIINISGKQSVYVVRDSTAFLAEVETGISSGEFIEIRKGLKEGDSVVVKGQSYVKDGGKVRVVGGNV